MGVWPVSITEYIKKAAVFCLGYDVYDDYLGAIGLMA